MGKTGNQCYATFCVNLLALSYGLAAGWTSAAIPLLKSSRSPLQSGMITTEEASLIGSLLTIGGFFGTIIFGYFSTTIGRKNSMLLMSIPQIAGWILVHFAESASLLILFRFLAGISAGGVLTVCSGYITEISSVKVRGMLGSTMRLFFCGGMLLAYIFGAVLPYAVVPWASLTFSVVFLYGFWYVPDTPLHLLKKGNYDGAEFSLRYFRGDENDESLAVRNELQIMMKTVEASANSNKFSLKDLSGKHSRKVLAYGFILMALHQACGCFPMLNYTKTIFELSGSTLSANASSIIVGVVQILGAFLCTFLVERAGRKILFCISAFGISFGLGVMSWYTYQTSQGIDMSHINWVPLVSFSFVMFIYNWGLNTLPFLYISEIVETKNKGFTLSFNLALLFGFSSVVLQFLSTLIQVLGMHGLFLLFSVNSLIGAILIVCFLPETKGKSYDEIMKLISG